jgi:hypothetical protein
MKHFKNESGLIEENVVLVAKALSPKDSLIPSFFLQARVDARGFEQPTHQSEHELAVKWRGGTDQVCPAVVHRDQLAMYRPQQQQKKE